jgi:dipeptidyl aminopeptidase/acylaminoacyl peptidase
MPRSATLSSAWLCAATIYHTNRLAARVLVLQGLHDNRTLARQVQVYERRLKALGREIEVCWFEAGHFGAGTDHSIENFVLMLQFARKACSVRQGCRS